jgi:hypothetical protein
LLKKDFQDAPARSSIRNAQQNVRIAAFGFIGRKSVRSATKKPSYFAASAGPSKYLIYQASERSQIT